MPKNDTFGYGKVNASSTLDPLISFAFPSRLRGSITMPSIYLMAIFGYDTRFLPLLSRVSFSSKDLVPIGPPILALPRLLLQTVMLKPNSPEGFIDLTVITRSDEAEGYDAVYIDLSRRNF